MSKNSNTILKKIIYVIIFILIAISILILVFINNKNNKPEEKISNEITDSNETINSINNTITDSNETTNSINNTTADLESEKNEESKLNNTKTKTELHKYNGIYTYMILKHCITEYYTKQSVNLIDKEAREGLNLNEDNIKKLYNNTSKLAFCIDEVYVQILNNYRNVYLVNYKIQTGVTSFEKKSILIKIDKEKNGFSIYPYEFLQLKNFVNAKEHDKLQISEDIDFFEINKFTNDQIDSSQSAHMTEFFSKYKFDLKLDLEHLFSVLSDEYKRIRFNNSYEEFLKYIEENKQILNDDQIKSFQVNKGKTNIEYLGISQNRKYIFNAKDLINYTVSLDGYTVATKNYKKLYDAVFPSVEGKYCLDRIKKAINDKNYEFIYEKLNSVPKSNYYPNFEDFKNYISTHFYEQNDFTYKKYYKISSYVYQYDVIITDATKNLTATIEMTATVNLTDTEDFTFSFKIK